MQHKAFKHFPIGNRANQHKINDVVYCDAPVHERREMLYGDPGTEHVHECRAPICPTCGKLITRPITAREKATVWTCYSGASSTPPSDIAHTGSGAPSKGN